MGQRHPDVTRFRPGGLQAAGRIWPSGSGGRIGQIGPHRSCRSLSRHPHARIRTARARIVWQFFPCGPCKRVSTRNRPQHNVWHASIGHRAAGHHGPVYRRCIRLGGEYAIGDGLGPRHVTIHWRGRDCSQGAGRAMCNAIGNRIPLWLTGREQCGSRVIIPFRLTRWRRPDSGPVPKGCRQTCVRTGRRQIDQIVIIRGGILRRRGLARIRPNRIICIGQVRRPIRRRRRHAGTRLCKGPLFQSVENAREPVSCRGYGLPQGQIAATWDLHLGQGDRDHQRLGVVMPVYDPALLTSSLPASVILTKTASDPDP